MNFLLTSDEAIILRDGRPFGDEGMMGGHSLVWPYPHTLTGMIRTKVGLSRDHQYFKDKEKRNGELLKETIRLNRISPYLIETSTIKYLAQIPADVFFTDHRKAAGKLKCHKLRYQKLPAGNGTDILNPEWLYPMPKTKEKPSKSRPFLMHWDFFDPYMMDKLSETDLELFDIGIRPPVLNERFHNALDSKTRVTQQGKLFKNSGFYFKTYEPEKETDSKDNQTALKYSKKIIDLGIHLNVNGLDSSDDISGDVYLGGERKRAILNKTDLIVPTCPGYFENRSFLKLVLQTHGNFGGWCPEWLKPDLQKKIIQWATIPDTSYRIRLRSAVVNGRDGVSGWDYLKGKPKAMMKLARPGSVFLIEIQNPNESQQIANLFWGKTLCMKNSQAARDGFGQVFVANETHIVI